MARKKESIQKIKTMAFNIANKNEAELYEYSNSINFSAVMKELLETKMLEEKEKQMRIKDHVSYQVCKIQKGTTIALAGFMMFFEKIEDAKKYFESSKLDLDKNFYLQLNKFVIKNELSFEEYAQQNGLADYFEYVADSEYSFEMIKEYYPE